MADRFSYSRPPKEIVWARTATTAGESFAVPREWVGKQVTFCADACKVYIATGRDAAPTVNTATVSTYTVGISLVPAGGEAALSVPTGAQRNFFFTAEDRFITIVCDNTTGKWQAFISDMKGLPA